MTNVRKYREQLNIPDAHKIVLYSGNMGVKQGLDIIIEAADIMKHEKVTFLMCGTGADCLRLKKISKELTNIIWIDLQPLEHLNELLSSADIHLLPQLPGAADLLMPSKLNGMLSSGRPIIAAAEKNTQIEKVVRNCGIVVPPNNSEAFSKAILLLINDTSLSLKLGLAAREYAEIWLEHDAIMKRFEQEMIQAI
jgi:colanic acid biosynthesis glycosyl transferase WcaI